MDRQYDRKCNLVVGDKSSNGLELSEFRIQFKINQSDIATPNNAIIRVFNLSDDTAKRVQTEFDRVILMAGYQQGPYGSIFTGTIKQVRRGRESPTDTYLDIVAADGDVPYNFGVVSKTMAAGATPGQQVDEISSSMGVAKGSVPTDFTGALPRGKVLFGMGRDKLDDVSRANDVDWSISDGKLQMIKRKAYLPGEAVVLNAATGMIGLPEQTEQGIEVRCLLNPNIRIGGLVHIDNKSVQQSLFAGPLLNTPGRLEQLTGFKPTIANDGFYRVYVAEYHGDTRGVPWYADLTCLAIDRSAAPASSVLAK